jgi:pyruvate dehydrogenase E2 component (dihydrolipoamide acetyltransferase)
MAEIKFVDVGEGITEGHVAKWLVKDGDTVKEDQSIVQIETDKAIVNVPAPISGKVTIVAKEGSTLKVGDSIATIGAFSAPAPAKPAPAATPKADTKTTATTATPTVAPTATPTAASVSAPKAAPTKANSEIIATPAVRHLAHELDVDISTITGTGPNGRILENDIRTIASGEAKKASPVPKFSEVLEKFHSHEIERVPMSQTRKAIARNMELSWTIPRAVDMELINGEPLFSVVSKEKENVMKKMKVKLTFLPFIIKAVVQALKDSPSFNSSYDRDTQEIILKKYYNIGIAAEAPDGLKVVVIKDADSKTIIQIAKEIEELHAKVLNQTVTLDDMKDSTFTITNIGSLGGGFLSVPMINYPEVAILGVHLFREMPVVVDGKIVVGRILPLSLSFDHRVVDGAEGVKFMNKLKEYIEDPDFLDMI